MLVPGSNLANMAFMAIARASVQYYKFLSRATNSVGLDVNTYAAPIEIKGSWQAVPRNLYESLGLDFNNNYIMFYTTTDVRDVGRDTAGDQLRYNGKVWQVLWANDWKVVDGWTGVCAVEVGPIPVEPTPPEEPVNDD